MLIKYVRALAGHASLPSQRLYLQLYPQEEELFRWRAVVCGLSRVRTTTHRTDEATLALVVRTSPPFLLPASTILRLVTGPRFQARGYTMQDGFLEYKHASQYKLSALSYVGPKIYMPLRV